jgi:hypothetical protein
MTRAIKRLTVIFVLFGICLAQQAQTSNQSQKPEGNVAIDYGSLFYVYDKSVNIKTRNESLDAFAVFLKDNPNFKGYLISYGARGRANALKAYLSKVGKAEPDRVEIIDGPNCREWRIDLLSWVTAAPEKPPAMSCLHSKAKSKRSRLL